MLVNLFDVSLFLSKKTSKMLNSKIAGVGHYVPEQIVTNEDLAEIIDTSDAWIIERTGINERRYFDSSKDTVANMAARAAEMALERAKVDKEEIDFIILASITTDYYFPGSGVLLQRELGLSGVASLDVKNACSGFVYALSIADKFIKTGTYKNVLVVGSEIQSSLLDMTDRGRSVAVIFGDGAGAVLMQPTEEPTQGVLSTHLHADGNFAEELCVKDPGGSRPREERLAEPIVDLSGFRVHMNGNLVFKHAVTKMHDVVMEALEENNVKIEDIDLLIPHQANLRISNFLQEKLALPHEKVYNNIMRYGNTTAASIPIAMSEAWAEGKLKAGDLLCIAAFGSGFTWASALVRW